MSPVVDVLCVEDDDTVRTLAESILQTSGYATLSASTIDQATALVESEKKIDVLFTEIGLLGEVEAGLRLAQEARKQRSDLAVLYTSAQAVTDGMKELFVENSFFLPKPYTGDQLIASLVVHFGLRGHDAATVKIPSLPTQPPHSRDHI
jgi:DNA-binding NtrC family response regulator